MDFRIAIMLVLAGIVWLTIIIGVVVWAIHTRRKEIGEAKKEESRKSQLHLCTSETYGRVVRHFPSHHRMIVVAYQVEDKTYEIYTGMIYRIEKVYKIGFLPVGQKLVPKLSDFNSVLVRYNPDCPSQAYLPENAGKWTLT